MDAAGVPDPYLDTTAITRDWFAYQVRSITDTTSATDERHGHIEVFTRPQA